MRLGPVLLGGLAALATAGCGGAKPDASATANAQAPMGNALLDPDKELARRWDKLFSDPAAAVAAANEFGYKAGPYAASGTTFGATGEQLLPDAKAPVTVRTRFAATGAAAGRVDAVTFTFDISDTTRKNSAQLDKIQAYPSRIVRGFLGRFDVSAGDDARRAIQEFQSVTADRQGGGTVKVDTASIPGAGANARRITVMIFKTGAPAPAQPLESAARK
ncbi:MAG: hypothetical protein V4574_00360 [Pseudomonadota bacterium]